MKHTIAILAFILPSWLIGQTMELSLVDSNQEPIPQAHIKYFNESDTLSGVSDYMGQISFPKLSGKCWLNVTHVAFQSELIPLTKKQNQVSYTLTRLVNQLDPVVVTGQASERRASQLVTPVKVISRDRIDKQAAINLRELLTNDLNIRISEDPVLGARLSLGGLDGQKVKILVDGVPMIGRLNGNLDLSQINLNNIERVEIVQGPMSVQYGTDALGGTINLITKKDLNQKLSTKINSYYQSIGRYNFDLSLGLPIKNVDINLNVGRNFFDGFDLNDTRDQQWNPKEQYFTQLGLKYRFQKSLLSFNANFFDETITNKGAIGSIDSLIIPLADTIGAFSYPRALDDLYRTLRFDNTFNYQYFIAPKKIFKVHLAHNYYRRIKRTDIINLSTLETSLFGGQDAQDTTVFQTINSRAFYENYWIEDKLDYQLGYEFTHDENSGERIEGGFKSLTDIALFASMNYEISPGLKLKPGLRYIYNSGFQSPLIYSLATKYALNSKWSLRASFGKGFRAPTLKELYFFFVDVNHNILGNQDLEAEYSHNYQLNVSYQNQRKEWMYEASANLFFNDVKNEIRLVSVEAPDSLNRRGLFTNVNIAESQSIGGNIGFKCQYKRFSQEVGLSVTGVKNFLSFSEEAQLKGINDFLFHPQLQANFSYNIPVWDLSASVFVNVSGVRQALDYDREGALRVIQFESFTLSDFTLQKKFWDNKLMISGGVKNLFNVVNIQSNAITSGGAHNSGTGIFPINFGRNFFARLQLNL